MQNRRLIGIIVAVFGIITGLLLLYYLSDMLMPVVHGKQTSVPPRPDEAIAVYISYTLLGWLGIAAIGIWVAVIYGFALGKEWAWRYGVLASSLQLLAGFFPMIPAASIDLPPQTLPAFLLAFVVWLGVVYVGKLKLKTVIFLLFVGMAYVLSFMNGVADISKFQTSTDEFMKGLFILSLGVTWIGSGAWLIVLWGSINKKSYVIPLGIMAATIVMLTGYILGITNVMEVHRFSMFLMAPIISTGLLIYLLLPSAKKVAIEWDNE